MNSLPPPRKLCIVLHLSFDTNHRMIGQIQQDQNSQPTDKDDHQHMLVSGFLCHHFHSPIKNIDASSTKGMDKDVIQEQYILYWLYFRLEMLLLQMTNYDANVGMVWHQLSMFYYGVYVCK